MTNGPRVMNRVVRLIASTLLIVGGLLVLAGLAYFSWLMWTSPSYAFFSLVTPLLIVSGVILVAIGMAIRSSGSS